MSSELVKKLDAEWTKWDADVEDRRHPNWQSEHRTGFLMGIEYAANIVEQHEAQQMKEPFYQLDEEQENLLNELQIVSREIKCLDLDEVLDKCYHKRLVNEQLAILWESLDVIPKNQVFNAFTTWAIEQKK